MGILNVTPDSFSDGGLFLDGEAAIEHGLRLVAEGADIVDVGGESTRPGAQPVDVSEELRRVVPVVSALARHGIAVSIDTMKPEVARAALESGATIVNDVSGLRSSEMRKVCAESGATVCIMHMLGEPRTMQTAPAYGDVVREVSDYLVGQAELAIREGIAKERIWLDPGIGFGKTVDQNLMLLKNLPKLVEQGYPVLVGVSRKSFLGKLGGSEEVPATMGDRLPGTLAAQVLAVSLEATIIRCHDVREARLSLQVAEAILEGLDQSLI